MQPNQGIYRNDAPRRHPPRLHDALDDQSRLVGPVKHPLGHLCDDGRVGEGTSLEVDGILEAQKSKNRQKCRRRLTYGCRDVSTSDTLNGCIEIVEGFALDNLSTDLTTDTEGRETALDNNESAYILAWYDIIAEG